MALIVSSKGDVTIIPAFCWCMGLTELNFATVGLKLQGPVPIAFVHRPLHMYFSSLNILETVEMWLDAQPAGRKRKPLVVPPRPRKL